MSEQQGGQDSGPETGEQTLVCYRHPDRPTRVRCQRCERPICPEDMHPGAVGFLCPDDARDTQKAPRRKLTPSDPVVTYVLVGTIGVAFLGAMVLPLQQVLALFPPLVGPAGGEWWRLITVGFAHAGLIHVGFNGYLLYLLGRMLEPALGGVRFGALYLAGLLGGSLGAVLLSPRSVTVGASGAVFGLMGAAMIGLRRRGVNPWRTDIGTLVILNLVLTFVIGGISIGGHIGGLAAGAAAGWALFQYEDRQQSLGTAMTLGLCVLLGVAGVVMAPG